MNNDLSSDDLGRYSRQISLHEMGQQGQTELRASSVLIIGIGGLGCPVAMYLNSAGIGRLGLMDHDCISVSNLPRQILFSEDELGHGKVNAAAERLGRMNSDTQLDLYPSKLDAGKAEEIFRDYDVIVDAGDNFDLTYLINDICYFSHKKFMHGAVQRFSGQVAAFDMCDQNGAVNYRDIFPVRAPAEFAPSCERSGILGAMTGQVGCVMAMETIKMVCGVSSGLSGKILLIDALSTTTRLIPIKKAKKNILREESYSLNDVKFSYQRNVSKVKEITSVEIYAWANRNISFQIIDVREVGEHLNFSIGGLNLPMAHLHENPSIPGSWPIVLYCQSGNRSSRGAAMLQELHPNAEIYSLQGGLDALTNSAVQLIRQLSFNSDGVSTCG